MSTNPFLSSATAETSVFGASESTFFLNNPFSAHTNDEKETALLNTSAGGTNNSNPFLNFDIPAEPLSNTAVSNPFAQFLSNATPNSSTKQPEVEDLLGNFSQAEAPLPQPVSATSAPSLPASQSSSRRSSLSGEPPRRPPPPRPSISKETKDLIQNITGKLERTSSDLLERLQATRTPSPTPLEELQAHSPLTVNETEDSLEHDGLSAYDKHGNGIQQEAPSIFEAIANLAKSEEFEEKSSSLPPPLSPPTTFGQSALGQTPPTRPPPPALPIQQPESNISDLLKEQRPSDFYADDQQSTNDWPAKRDSLTKQSPFSVKGPAGGAATLRKTSYDYSAARESPLPVRKFSVDNSSIGVANFGQSRTSIDGSEDGRNKATAKASPSVVIAAADNGASDVATATPVIEPTDYDGSNIIYDNNIAEVPKFPIISTTPIMSYENIANEQLYDENVYNTSSLPTSSATIYQYEPDTKPVVDDHSASRVDNDPFTRSTSDFDAFEKKFESCMTDTNGIKTNAFDPFGDTVATEIQDCNQPSVDGFGAEATFDEFLALNQYQAPHNDFGTGELRFEESQSDSWPPPATDVSSRQAPPPFAENFAPKTVQSAESVETPSTPLFDEDISQPLEPFPRSNYTGPGWEMQIRYPIRKKFTGQRFWKKVFVRLVYKGETPHLELINKDDSKETIHHEWPLQPTYAISDIGAQQYDQYGKIFTVKIQFVVYKERPGVRPGQVTKAERLTNKLSQFAAYAIQGDYQGVKEFGSDLKKLGLPVEHSPQISLICKLGSHNYEDMKQFSSCVEDALFKLSAHRDDIHINYKMEEVQITAVDELYVEQNVNGSVTKQIARVRLFFLGFLTGMPDVDIGVNDLRRQGKEIVGRHDIIPVPTEEWIRLENIEFHSCIQQEVYEELKTIKLKPPDACYLELMRFRVRPPKNRELPLQLKVVIRIYGKKVDINADIIVPGFTSRKLGQIPCEDVAVRIPIPECWIYLFRVEKHFRYGSVKSAHRRTGKIKGIERFLGAVDTLETHLIEVTSGHAKYEHHHKAIVWRMSRLPKEGQGAYTSHNMVCHMVLTSFDQIPPELDKYCFVEFTMPMTQVSHMTVRSVSITNSDSDSPPEKCVRHLARHEYRVEIEHIQGPDATNDYIAATMTKPKPSTQTTPVKKVESIPESESDSD